MDKETMTATEALLSYKQLVELMLDNESIVNHHEKLDAIREIIVDELSNKKPVFDEYIEQVIISIVLPIKNELKMKEEDNKCLKLIHKVFPRGSRSWEE
jgi:hypothetical protein